jgi:hypothetical protein
MVTHQPAFVVPALLFRSLLALGLGLVVGAAVGALAVGCSSTPLPPVQEIPALIRCQLSSLSVLPGDPRMATVYDAVDVIERLRACERQAVGDGGAP